MLVIKGAIIVIYTMYKRTDEESYATEESRRRVMNGQVWKPELGFVFLKEELGL